MAFHLADFAALMADKIGDRVHSAAPINESWCVAWLSHFLGHHAPGLRDIRAASRAMHHVLLAHGTVMQAWRSAGLENLGAVLNVEKALPATPNDKAAALEYDGIYNRWFAEAIATGEYPRVVLDGLEQHMPLDWQDDMALISQPLDWLGVNFYTGKYLQRGPSGFFGDIEEVPSDMPLTSMDWPINADWLRQWLVQLTQTFGAKLPVYVTENGMASGSGLQDADRIVYLHQHLNSAIAAIGEGVDLRGYFIWSLLDNYEWAYGYGERFGLVHVDFETMQRTPKESYRWMQEVLKSS